MPGVRGAGCQPLTEQTFAQAMTVGMTDLGTAHLDMEIGEIVLVDGEVFFREERAPVYFQAPDYLTDQLVAQMGRLESLPDARVGASPRG